MCEPPTHWKDVRMSWDLMMDVKDVLEDAGKVSGMRLDDFNSLIIPHQEYQEHDRYRVSCFDGSLVINDRLEVKTALLQIPDFWRPQDIVEALEVALEEGVEAL